MQVATSYPGVYIQELSSGVHTITGVATSIAAFIGRAIRGPVNKATTITSYGDFERIFGGLTPDSMLGYAVQDFFRNGGSQAIIVRLYKTAGALSATFAPGGLLLKASSEGTWANSIVTTTVVNDGNPSVAARLGVLASELFSLKVQDRVDNPTAVETFHDLTVSNTARRYDQILEQQSSLVRANAGDPYASPGFPTAAADIGTTLAAGVEAALDAADFITAGPKKGLHALDDADLFNMLCIPPYNDPDIQYTSLADTAAAYCHSRRAMLILDAPSSWSTAATAVQHMKAGDLGTVTEDAAVFFPRYSKPNTDGLDNFPVCGAVAGVFARTDAERGVWKAPAGLDATLLGVPTLTVHLTDAENGLLNPLGVNCLREMPGAGRVVWGSRTLKGDDRLANEWKYIPVRRTALFIEESLYRGTQWVVFEPNDEPLWAQIRLNIGAFMNGLFRQGAFQGKTRSEAYFVKCDKETTTQTDINNGVVNIIVGFAPLKPAEFVIISFQQMAGQIDV